METDIIIPVDNNYGEMVTNFGTKKQEIWVWLTAEATDFSFVQTVEIGSDAHLAPYSMGTAGYFSGGKEVGVWSWPLNPI